MKSPHLTELITTLAQPLAKQWYPLIEASLSDEKAQQQAKIELESHSLVVLRYVLGTSCDVAKVQRMVQKLTERYGNDKEVLPQTQQLLWRFLSQSLNSLQFEQNFSRIVSLMGLLSKGLDKSDSSHPTRSATRPDASSLSDRIFSLFARDKKASRPKAHDLQQLAEFSSIAIAIIQEQRIVYVNSLAIQCLGAKSAEQILGQDLQSFIPATSQKRLAKSRGKTTQKIQIGKAIELKLKRSDGILINIEAIVLPIIYENHPADFFIFHDITPRKQFLSIMQNSESLYQTLVETCPDAISVTDLNGRLLTMNRQMALLCGYKDSHELLFHHSNIAQLVPSAFQEKFSQIRRQLLQHGSIQNITFEMIRRDSGTVPVELNARLIRNRRGRPVGIMKVIRDISNRIDTEKASRERQQLLQSLIDASPEGIVFVNLDGAIRHINLQGAQMLGFQDEEDFLNHRMRMLDSVVAEQQEQARQFAQQTLQNGVIRNVEFTALKKDQSTLAVEISAAVVRNENEEPSAFSGVIRDITARKAIENRLVENERRYRELAESAEDAIFILNSNGIIEYVNKFGASLFGKKPEQLIGLNHAEQFGGRIDKQKKNMAKAFDSGKPVFATSKIPFPQKSVWLSTRLVPLRNEHGQITRLLGIARNISKLKEAQQALSENVEKYHRLIHHMKDAIFILEENRIVEWNSAAEKMFLFTETELKNKSLFDLFKAHQSMPKNAKLQLDKFLKNFSSGNESRLTWQMLRKDRTELTVEIAATRFKLAQKWRNLAVLHDVTDKIKQQKALEASEQRHRDIIERCLDGYFFLSLKGKLERTNAAYIQLFRQAREQVQSRELRQKALRDLNILKKSLMPFVLSGRNIPKREFEILGDHGQTICYVFNARRVIREGFITGIEGFVRDVSEDHRTRDRLQNSEARYRALFNNIPYEVFALDPSGHFAEANDVLIQRYGDPKGRTVAQTNFPPAMKKAIQYLLKSPPTKQSVSTTYEVSGDPKSHFNLLLDAIVAENDQILGFVGLNVDITNQIKLIAQSRDLTARLVQTQEAERARIAREIHDSLGQVLTALQFEIGAAMNALPQHTELAQQFLRETRIKISQITSEVHDLSHVLRPALLDDFGLIPALEDYIAQISRLGQLDIVFESVPLKGKLTRDAETALFRIAQEAMTNVIKHACAKHVRITIDQRENTVQFTFQDDGIGFAVRELRRNNSSHLGLLGMQERVEILDGTFKIKSRKNQGTEIKITIPIQKGA